MLFFWTLSKNPEKKYHGLLKNIKLNNGFNIDNNNKCFLSNKFRVISEESCDTEDCNDSENSALITEINCIQDRFK